MIRKLFLLSGICLSLNAQTNEQYWQQACSLYKQNNYAQAIEKAQLIQQKSGAVWVLISAALYEQEQYAQALVALRRAQQRPSIALYRPFCMLAERLQEKIPSTVMSYKERLFFFVNTMPLIGLQTVFLIHWGIFLGMLYYWRKKRLWVIGILAILQILLASFLGVHYYANTRQLGVVVSQAAPLFIGPDTKYSQRETIKYGTQLYIQEKGKEWAKVKTDGLEGWMLKQDIEIV